MLCMCLNGMVLIMVAVLPNGRLRLRRDSVTGVRTEKLDMFLLPVYFFSVVAN